MIREKHRIGLLLAYSLIVVLFLFLLAMLVLPSTARGSTEVDGTGSSESTTGGGGVEPPLVDPSLHSAFLVPTAITLPRGTLSMEVLGIQTLGVRWGISNRIQLNLGFRLIGFYTGATVNLFRGRQSALSLEAGIGLPVTSFDGDYPAAWVANPVYSLGDDDLMFTVGTLAGGISARSGALLIPYANITKRIARKVKVFFQVNDGISLGPILGDDHDGAHYLFAVPGLRFHGKKLSCDLGLILPVYYEGMADDPYFVVPFPSFSFRF